VTGLSLRTLTLVGLGSGIGGVLRALLIASASTRASTDFPVGVLLVNVLGSFVFGVAVHYGVSTSAMSDDTRRFLTTGLCGGFTTFSAFSMDVVGGVSAGRQTMVAVYILLSVVLSAAALWGGMLAAGALSRPHA
jgi:fluoride exporter